MADLRMLPTRCAICGTEGNATELYAANFDAEAFNPAVFSARRLPDRVHYRMVKCNSCGLVRSDPAADRELHHRLYAQSSFDYDAEVENLKATYGRYLAGLGRFAAGKTALLEIGCGNGFFLEEALAQGYGKVRGVEPSAEAVAKAGPALRPHIVCDIMRPGLFGPEEFDTVCMFQVLDHVFDPGPLLQECRRVLKPGGLVLCLNHDVGAPAARLLKARCPIVDVEHTYLYSRDTIAKLFEMHGFVVKETGAARNRYSLHYIARLLPLPAGLKRSLLRLLKRRPLADVSFFLPLGNLYIVAQKPL